MPPLLVTALLWGAVVGLAVLTVLVWRQRPRPGATALALTLLAATWWVAAETGTMFVATGSLGVVLLKIQWAGVAFAPVGWFVFALRYTGRDEYVTPRTVLSLSAFPVATVLFAMTNSAHHLLYASLDPVAYADLTVFAKTYGPVALAFFAYAYLLLAAGAGLILRLAAGRVRYREQVAVLLAMVLAPAGGGLADLLGLGPTRLVDPTPFTFLFTGLAGLAALTRFEVFEAVPVSPRAARSSLIEAMETGAVVVDGAGRVVELNGRAATILGVEREAVLGADAASLLPEYERVAADCDERETLEFPVDGESRVFEVGVAESETEHLGDGRVLTFHDVTERQRRLQRLDVLNRVLRHNLRNEMNVVYGYADHIESEGDPRDADAIAGRIKDKAMEMVELGNRARAIDEVLRADRSDPTVVPVTTVLDWERDRLTDRDLAVAVDADGVEAACDATLGTVLKIAVETVLEHTTADRPAVRFAATVDGETARIEVTADGTSIPERERRVIAAGEETKLKHGSGLGLWLSNWGVQALGGTLEVSDDALVVSVPCDTSPAAPSDTAGSSMAAASDDEDGSGDSV
ncbi:MAG: histidine kinase N-terminal 7TM domain-containing protein [Haloarculaceae archaeon]